MKKTLLMLAFAVGALAAAGIAWSSGALGGGPAQIRVYGGGVVATPTGPRTISLDAAANPQGAEAYGSFHYASSPPGTRGEVTCLSVVGNAALVGGFIRESPAANLIGADFLYGVIDSGLPGSGTDQAGYIDVTPELDPYSGLPADFPRTCPTAAGAQQFFGAYPLTGDVSIETP
jgi:hypothetical protein